MNELKKESKLYERLSDLFDENREKITLDIYKKAVEIVREYEKEEIQFVLFKLKYLDCDIDTGLGVVNKCLKISTNMAKTITRKPYKLAFIYSVLETA